MKSNKKLKHFCRTGGNSFLLLKMSMSNKSQNLESPENYFCMDDIISSNEKVPCRFDVDLRKLGEIAIMQGFVSVCNFQS